MSAKTVDDHEEIWDAMYSFVKLALLFHSASPWDDQKRSEWDNLQIPVLDLATAKHLSGFQRATTKGLCDLGRAILGIRPEKESS